MTDTLRGCIVAEANHTFIAIDASQIELRCLAHISQDPRMLEDLKTGDLHMASAIRMFGWVDDVEEMKVRRYKAKQANFALVYGADEYKLSEMLECSLEEAQAFMAEHKQAYPVLYQWKDTTIAKAKEDGYVMSSFGRIRPLPDLHGGTWRIRQKAEREVVNSIIQGMAVDIVKMAGLYLRGRMDKRVRFVLQVHDEWLLEVPEDLVEETKAVCLELKTIFPTYPFDMKIGNVYSRMEGV